MAFEFTVQQLENLANAALDYFEDRGKVESQTIQNKPLLTAMRAAQKTFPGGKENISVGVKGVYTTGIQGFSGSDEVSYSNPANIKRAYYPWKEIHSGIEVTFTELKKDGISIRDSALGKGEIEHSQRELTVLADIFQDKLEDMQEGTDRGMNEMFWMDGSQDSSVCPGIRSFILDDPTAATVVGGIDQSVNSWWRNRAALNLSTATPSDLVIGTKLQNEFRQLRRYVKNWKPLWLGGSDFLDAFEQELRSKGYFTQTGWASKGRIDASVSDVSFKNVALDYDPTLDDMGLSKYSFIIDQNVIQPRVMEGEDMKTHNPARPANKYVLYRAKTWTGGMVCRRRNSSGVYSIA